MIKAGDNLLIANPKYDITNDVVKGLNKRYKIKDDVKELIKDAEGKAEEETTEKKDKE